MPRWTNEQLDAINKESSNIIVSAGAGSGKTAVLTARVIRKLESGINVNELLVLTFTKAAAFEMKERIRKAIKKQEKLHKQLDFIEGAYITTFDSYSLSLVKKYHYLLNIPNDISIIDASIIYQEKRKIIDNIFDKLYEEKNAKFLNLIGDFCIKDDDGIKKYVLTINDKLDLKYDKEEYLKDYLTNYFNEQKLNNDLLKYEKVLLNKIKEIKEKAEAISYFVDTDYTTVLYDNLSFLFNSNNYLQIKNSLDIKLPNLPRGSGEEAKGLKLEITNILKELKTLTTYKDEKDILNSILLTKDYVSIIIDIILDLDRELNIYKYENNLYEFNDISKMAISLLKNHREVKEEVKYSFNEIMVDEYQDTSDLQEDFLKLIENNNIYMVGDIKQSIYRFRNANPYIFKDKYDSYSKNINGYKIDLNKNFRSRKEVLDNINVIFNVIMDDDIGGADYKENHQMVFGNNTYLEDGKTDQNNNLEILNYTYDKDLEFTKEEIEIFTIGNDIKEKIENKYQIFDKDKQVLRDIKYSDFVILLDRATKFDKYKKVFEYLGIPLTKYTDTSITKEDDILIIKNILKLIINLKYNKKDTSFKYAFTSIARSFLFSLPDDEILSYHLNNNYEDSNIMKIILEIVEHYNDLSPSRVMELIIEKFDFINKLITVGNINLATMRLDYLMDISNNLTDMSYSISDFYNYLDKLIEDDYDIKATLTEINPNSVSIMTIHKSKGLEYHICYYAGVYAKFNISDLKERFLYDKNFGIIAPFINDGINQTIYKTLLKEEYIKEEISEKIRLFYVALTRAKEKMIIVSSLENKQKSKISYRSFLDILNSIYQELESFMVNIDINSINLTRDYNKIKQSNYKEKLTKVENKMMFEELKIENETVEKETFSKNNIQILNEVANKNIELGNKLHSLFEITDFKKPNLDIIDNEYKGYINNFLESGLDFKTANIYKEYEFIDDSEKLSHGIIDLMLEYEDKIIIVDYKLKNISDASYLKQLNGYKNHIEKKTNKKVNMYLYSILDNNLESVKK